jgi:oxepin-CoA hydrolase/3-oxo-5,6-dehydrosuberyl-CoA semialdehyde dehydrogenase
VRLASYVGGRWRPGADAGVALRDATTGEVVAEASSAGIDFGAVLAHAREAGGPALRRLTFHERAALLRALAKHLSAVKEEFYGLSYHTGATRSDAGHRHRVRIRRQGRA